MSAGAREHASAAAAELGQTLAGREASHGDWQRNAEIATTIKEQLTGIEDPVLRETADAIACKLARAASGGELTADTWYDVAGYALLAYGHLKEQDQ